MTDSRTQGAGAGSREAAWKPASPEPLSGTLPPPSPRLLARVEEVLELQLPASFRQFLARGNGGRPRVSRYLDRTTGQPASVAQFLPWEPGHPGSLFACLESHGERLPPGTLPIARDRTGNLLLLGLDRPWGGEVLLWEVEREPEKDAAGNLTWINVHPVAASFGEFLESFVED